MILNALGEPVKIEKFVPHTVITPGSEVITYPEKSYFYNGFTVTPVPQSILDEAYQRGYESGLADAKPYARELEYIQSSGTQYIDTGFIPKHNTRVKMDFKSDGVPSSYSAGCAGLFGIRHGTSSNAFGIWFNDSEIYPHYGNVGYNANGLISLSTKQRLIYELNARVLNVYSNTTSTKTCNSATFSCSYNMLLLSISTAGTVDERKAIGKLYSCQIYDNGTLVRDLIPVLTYSGEACLYDKVGERFYYNQGTGSFTYS